MCTIIKMTRWALQCLFFTLWLHTYHNLYVFYWKVYVWYKTNKILPYSHWLLTNFCGRLNMKRKYIFWILSTENIFFKCQRSSNMHCYLLWLIPNWKMAHKAFLIFFLPGAAWQSFLLFLFLFLGKVSQIWLS